VSITFTQGFAIGLFVGIGFGALIGMYVERVRWNNLIQAGILPKPRSRT
jgi:hypothetical protein